MDWTLVIFAVAGCAAVSRCLVRSTYRVVRQFTYVLYAGELAKARSRRGDLTGLEEAREWVARARKERRRALGEVGLWLALLAVPLYLVPEPEYIYAAYGVFWIRPGQAAWRRWQARLGGADGGKG